VLKNQHSVLQALPGSASASCVTVGSGSTVRSTSLAAGDFAQARSDYRHQHPAPPQLPTVTLQVIPEHPGSMPGVVVDVVPVGQGQPRTVRSHVTNTAGDVQYYSAQVPIQAPGTYRLEMRSGSDHGCFEVTFNR
jgi:hypothetical protein